MGEVRRLFTYARAQGRHLTFRAAGTSLSGQAVGDDIVVEVGAAWRGIRVLDGGARVWAQPGAIGGHVNRLLAQHRRRIGPDPASIDAATVGGILVNNASGMCCGVAQNSYHTLDSLTVLLADGTIVDTARPDAAGRLRRENPALHAGLAALRDRVRGDAALSAAIRRVFSLKNTTGYALESFLDYDDPDEILAHLMFGSQGTLGFVAALTLRTVADPAARATGLVLFDDLRAAGEAVPGLKAAGASAVEIMDAAALRAQKNEAIEVALQDRSAALLVEIAGEDAATLEAGVAAARRALEGFGLAQPLRFTEDAALRQRLWHLRKGLFPAIGGARPLGTATVIEDVAVPVTDLAAAVGDLQALFARHALSGTAIFGHAKDGNLHFVLAEDFTKPGAVPRYAQFMQDLVDVVLGRYGGALKAEHGSGRNMAPFVRAQWGDAAYGLMQEVKRLLDPCGILNPGVLLAADPEGHLRHLKDLPAVSPIVDRCIECGFCEPRCPSRDVTLTPRQRIVILRELARPPLATEEARRFRADLEDELDYAGIETCVGDSMCQTSCPVQIGATAAAMARGGGGVPGRPHGADPGAGAHRAAAGGARRTRTGNTLSAARGGAATPGAGAPAGSRCSGSHRRLLAELPHAFTGPAARRKTRSLCTPRDRNPRGDGCPGPAPAECLVCVLWPRFREQRLRGSVGAVGCAPRLSAQGHHRGRAASRRH
jgi:D-lactate dehydrogenase